LFLPKGVFSLRSNEMDRVAKSVLQINPGDGSSLEAEDAYL